MAIAKLSIDLEARLASLQEGLDKAGMLAANTAAKIDSSFSALKGTAISLGAGLATAFTVPALAAFITRTAEGVAALQDMATATGASVENLSALEDAAARTGTNFETLGDAIIKMNKALTDAKPGTEQLGVFEALNLDIKTLKALDPAEALQKIAKALAGFADDGNKARAVQVLFGKSLKEVAPLLKDLSEQTRLTATLTATQVAEAKKFNDELASLQKSVVDASRALTGPFITALNALIDKYHEARKEGKSFFGALFSPSALIEQAAKIGAPVQFSEAAGGGRGFVNPPVVQPSLPSSFDTGDKTTKAAVADLQKYIDTLIAAQVATLDLSTEEQARYDIANGKLGKLTQAQQQQVLDLARGVDLMKLKYGELEDAQSAFRKSELAANEATNEAMRQATAGLDAQIDAFSGRTADMLKRLQTARLEARLNAGEMFTSEELERIVNGIAGMTTQMSELGDTSERVGDQIALALTSAAGDAITHWQGFGNLIKGILEDMAQLALRETVLKPMDKWIGGALKGFDLGSLLGAGGSGTNWGSLLDLFGSFGGGYFAAGGEPPLNKISVVGERGPEFFVPRQAGTIVPNGRVGGGHTVNVAINVAAGASPDDWRRSQRQIASDLQRGLRRAGAIA